MKIKIDMTNDEAENHLLALVEAAIEKEIRSAHDSAMEAK